MFSTASIAVSMEWSPQFDRYNRHTLPVKDVYLYPLRRDYRRIPTSPA